MDSNLAMGWLGLSLDSNAIERFWLNYGFKSTPLGVLKIPDLGFIINKLVNKLLLEFR